MSKKRVLILYTGGTIGMRPSKQGYVPVSGFEGLLKKQLSARATDALPDYQVLEFDELIDSANLHPRHWADILAPLQKHWCDYDGFVVLHGTDTMAYSASALSFLLGGCDKPVLFTGSQIPLAELRNDALDNLITSLLLIAQYDLPEVCVYFNGRLLRGNRTRKLNSTGFDAFDSPNYPWLGQVGIQLQVHPKHWATASAPAFHRLNLDPNAVVLLPVFPGMSAQLLETALNMPRLKGLVLQSYGVGNPPDANLAWMDALQSACDRGITVLNTTQCLRGPVDQGAYATGSALNKIGVVAGADLTPEAAFAKLSIASALFKEPQGVRQALTQNWCGEMTPVTSDPTV